MVHGLWAMGRTPWSAVHGSWGLLETPRTKFSGASGVPWPGPIRRVQDHKDSDLPKFS
ncbi:hypothetical protein O181_087356, partial [Austropuccinia psidii MF-1]|nr:hypothetical protein [Austropuccinia psidii MF-1]